MPYSNPDRKPVSSAFRLALVYIVFCLTYIWLSGLVANWLATDKETLARIEQIKGFAFILVTGGLLFVYVWNYLHHLHKQQMELLRHRDLLAVAEQHALAGTLAAGVAHDMNNLLTGIFATLDLLQMDCPEKADLIDDLVEGTEAMAQLASRLQRAGQSVQGEDYCRFSPLVEVEQALRLVRLHSLVRKARLTVVDDGADAQLTGMPVMLQQAVFNLVLNAAEATGEQAEIQVAIQTGENNLVITVDDNGPGVPLDQREIIMDAFQSSRGKGRGLGLLMVRACADAHDGRLTIEDSELGGARFRLELKSCQLSR